MPAGRLRHFVSLQKRTQSSEGDFGLATSFALVENAWAEIEAVRGSVYAASIQTEEGPTHRITLRWRPATDFDFIFDGTRRFEVRDVRDPDGLRRWLVVNASEVTA